MTSLAMIAKQYQQQFVDEYGQQMKSDHYRALNAIINCHTPQAGALLYHCEHCHNDTTLFPSCGHRHCPACQHKTNNDWLDTQRSKLFPVDYYLVTFTLPAQLRAFAYAQQKWAYQSLFIAAKQTLDAFFEHDKQLGENGGYLAVLHTHSRRLEFHPHVHFVVPAGGLNKAKTQWQHKAGKYLFKAGNLARVFRGKFVTLMAEAGYYLPANTPKSWIADCEHVGSGGTALTYLARYLYRSVISEQSILGIHDGKVTFQYKESRSKQFKTITEPATAFLWRVLLHVLPKGFRRARNYGFLHGNAKATLQRLQLILKVRLSFSAVKQKKAVCCPQCQHEMQLYMMRIGTRLINIGSSI